MSVIATALKHMLAAGMDHDAIVAAVAEMEREAVPAVDRAADKRREWDRQRKRNQRNSTLSGGTQVETGGSPVESVSSPTPDKERSPTPPKEINPTPSSLRSDNKRGTRLPADFQPNLVFAVELGFDRSQAMGEFDKFRDYWNAKAGKDATKLDWPATWRNWLRNAAKPRNRPHQQAPPRETDHARHQREFREAIQQKLNGNPGHDEFTSTGPAFDLEPGDYNAH